MAAVKKLEALGLNWNDYKKAGFLEVGNKTLNKNQFQVENFNRSMWLPPMLQNMISNL